MYLIVVVVIIIILILSIMYNYWFPVTYINVNGQINNFNNRYNLSYSDRDGVVHKFDNILLSQIPNGTTITINGIGTSVNQLTSGMSGTISLYYNANISSRYIISDKEPKGFTIPYKRWTLIILLLIWLYLIYYYDFYYTSNMIVENCEKQFGIGAKECDQAYVQQATINIEQQHAQNTHDMMMQNRGYPYNSQYPGYPPNPSGGIQINFPQ
jgi:hypothetical protein